MRVVEGIVFLSLATGLHLGAWAVAPQRPGASSAGGDGTHEIALAAASPQVAVLARTWQAPRATGDMPETPRPPGAAPAAFDVPAADPAPAALPPAPGLVPVLPAALPRVPPARMPADAVPSALPAAPAPPTPETDSRAMPSPTADLTARPPAQADRRPPPPERSVRADRSVPPPPLPPKSASAPAPALDAAGRSAAKAQTSGSGKAGAARASDGGTSLALKAQWGARIQRKVRRRLVYPRGASGNGVTRIAITVDRAGNLTAMRVIGPSGVPAFDNAVLKAIRRSGRFPAAPDGLAGNSHSFTMSWTFSQ